MPDPIRVKRGGVLTPEWGNADRADADKIRVHYRFLSFAEQQELLDPADVGKSFSYESRVLSRMVDKVENLSVEDEDGKVRPIATGDALTGEPGLDKLALELWLTFRTMTAIDKKK